MSRAKNVMDLGKNTTVAYTEKAGIRLKEMAMQCGVTQVEFINLVLENVSIDVVRPFAVDYFKLKSEGQAAKKAVMEKLASLSPEQLARLVEQINA